MAHAVLKKCRDGSVLRLTLSRPKKHNALTEELVSALLAEIDRVNHDDTIRAVVVAGEGPSFCAGADIEWMKKEGAQSEAENRSSARRLAQFFRQLNELRVPLITRVEGACIGGGMGIVATSDVVVASSDARFATSEVRLGIVPAVIAPHLIDKLGPGHCRELMITGRRIDAAEALRLGLVHRVVPGADLDRTVDSVVDEIRLGSPSAQNEVKRLIRGIPPRVTDEDELDTWTSGIIAAARASADGRAGLDAFLNKQAPPWAGK